MVVWLMPAPFEKRTVKVKVIFFVKNKYRSTSLWADFCACIWNYSFMSTTSYIYFLFNVVGLLISIYNCMHSYKMLLFSSKTFFCQLMLKLSFVGGRIGHRCPFLFFLILNVTWHNGFPLCYMIWNLHFEIFLNWSYILSEHIFWKVLFYIYIRYHVIHNDDWGYILLFFRTKYTGLL